ncbi:hypothetical protein MG293_018047 [Ovis ammon polii]|uniref:Uncharacterized protein n=1 Tax=Ovis ammon polii TaxID=230172 RepID=A0AAD4TPI2_OVIAM|nr:hypothetical protein MG293_018047 [Ovis ammon polii]
MYFSIPETESRSGERGGSANVLRKEYGASVLPAFSPKKLLALTPAEVKQERAVREVYEIQHVLTEEISLEMLLGNGQKVLVNMLTSDQTEYVLEGVAAKLDIPDDLLGYFSLFLLQEFELPYVSVTSLQSQEYKTVLRKSYLDSTYDDSVMENWAGLNLLYAQMVADIKRAWILFLLLAQTRRHYGYLCFNACMADLPEKDCPLRLPGQQLREVSFPVTRMRCWWVTSSVPLPNRGTSSLGQGEVRLELAFEYLISNDQLQWVTITSPQAIMMSTCLQSMVDELMVKQSGDSIRKMLHRLVGGTLRCSDSQQAVKSPPLLESPDATRESMVKLSNKLSAVSLQVIGTPGTDGSASAVHGSFAFKGIGDEYL